MTRVRRAHYGALVGVGLVAGALVVTLVGEWPRVQSLLGGVMVVCSALLVLKTTAVVAGVLLRTLD
ncbi:hypothetical protein [Halorussus lipolyticus]|uniref:hypothetical protein n=1 Tax=Halorussus lipolyticus TaxID=3034024 RepID=UPI0023E80072|nr:hypothetical protein [Halorussus sp. DT80]